MPDLLWDDVKDFFDPDLMGSLPDVYIQNTTVDDLQALFDMVLKSCWAWEFSDGDTTAPLPTAAEIFARPADAECVYLRVRPAPDVLAIFRPYASDEIWFDIDLRELQGQERLDLLCGFFTAIGRRLGKPVCMTPEMGQEPVLGFEPTAGRVVLLADPRRP
ncbi:hypothetical protein [Catellatospora sp. NPDC049609]|uniref:hypothetical protein n=1 Tax=Catellatospora sp. NPDC049609 TaxID=3155505 RepID=UPI00342513E2